MASRLDGLTQTAARSVIAAGALLDAGRPDEASRCLADIRGADAVHPETLRMQAGILGLSGRHRDAVQMMIQAIELCPNDPLYHNTLGTLRAQLSLASVAHMLWMVRHVSESACYGLVECA
jgi:Flp pilus assembly protein TadD